MRAKASIPIVNLLIAVVIVVATITAVVTVVSIDPWAEQGSGLAERFDYDLDVYHEIDPRWIKYREVAQFSTSLQESRAIAVGPNDTIYLAGDRAIEVLDADGSHRRSLPLSFAPACLAVVGDESHGEAKKVGRMYVGDRQRVYVVSADGTVETTWDSPGERALFTSIAVDEDHRNVFVADAGYKIVWHYDTTGKLLGRIGQRDEKRNIPGFVIPSPYFDVAVAPDGLLRAVNPGGHRIEAYTFDGHLELVWGKPTMGLEGFCGCCNPAHMAVLRDGRIVTAEKGIPRVKVYSNTGQFEGVVAGPKSFVRDASVTEETRSAHRPTPLVVATDSQLRILVLDPAVQQVRVFESNDPKIDAN